MFVRMQRNWIPHTVMVSGKMENDTVALGKIGGIVKSENTLTVWLGKCRPRRLFQGNQNFCPYKTVRDCSSQLYL